VGLLVEKKKGKPHQMQKEGEEGEERPTTELRFSERHDGQKEMEHSTYKKRGLSWVKGEGPSKRKIKSPWGRGTSSWEKGKNDFVEKVSS